MANTILLRNVVEDDLAILFQQEQDPEANLMAAYPAKDKESFVLHWRDKILGENGAHMKTIIFNECVAGSIECWKRQEKWLVGYWIGKKYWGKGIATSALGEFLKLVKIRPLHANVPNHNKASVRVLEKCGFVACGHGTLFSEVHGHNVEETYFILN